MPPQNPATTSAIEPSAPVAAPAVAPAQFIKAEANLLRFPIFALSTKGLKNVDQIQCVGMKREGTQEHRFSLTVSRNTRFIYPGPLARKVHFALLSIVYEQGFPFKNPVGFTWRDLARRIQSAHGGDKIDRLKEAIRSIHGVVLTTEYALKSGADRQALPSRERGYHLYSDFVFLNEPLPDGGIADRNYVWFADWYLANLNSFYAAPIDYHLWRSLNEQSPIASRLYEFLLFNFAGRHPQLTINYAKLAQFLPVRVEQYLSLAQRQLGEAMELLQQNLVTRSTTWMLGKNNAIQLRFVPGPLIAPGREQERLPAVVDSAFLEDFCVTEIRTHETPSETIVRQFYRLWAGHEQTHPVKAEIAWANELLDQYGRRTVDLLMPAVIKRLKAGFPNAKTFGATRRYFAAAHADLERQHRSRTKRDDGKGVSQVSLSFCSCRARAVRGCFESSDSRSSDGNPHDAGSVGARWIHRPVGACGAPGRSFTTGTSATHTALS